MKTVAEILEAMKSFFHRRKKEPSRIFAEEVMCAALNCKKLDLYLDFHRPLNEEELERCRKFLRRRAKDEPIQYVLGEIEFFNCQINVSPHVLIPRPETEQLVEKIVLDLEKEDVEGRELWDVCTGSGCIGIALKKRFPSLSVTLSDQSFEALEIAKKNALKNGVDVRCLHGDLLKPFSLKKCHYLVSNPPYVSSSDILSLEPEVKNFEPKIALDGGVDGLAFYRLFSKVLPDYLHSGAKIWFEIGFDQGEKMQQIFQEERWYGVKIDKDYCGLNRFFSCCYRLLEPI